MVDFLKLVIEHKGHDMLMEERNLIAVAFKNSVSSRRTAWRTVVSVQNNTKYILYQGSLIEYKQKLEEGLFEDCNKIIALIQNNILKKKGCDDESKAFFTKLVADNYRYIAEMSNGERKVKAIEDAKQHYEIAQEVPLLGCSPTKLSVCLNMSVFFYEVMHDLPKACSVGETTLKTALERIDDLAEADFKEAKQMIDLIKENLNAWKEEEENKNKPIELVTDNPLEVPEQ